ncbi:DNA polymerase III subunit beta [Candidatus Vampirococcus lugosii]|uniref:Beta sliding clamp n=1 Tax=Candidatus Vampirococcus lugosii TaxID=2789015 RepID=A0ABS5QPJ6_9BACT|nr:DNA polymerase III subunit beta [Candidatus Vampirococcus lugosii]MBS8122498.1 DNA polymerase III subunit beta [Candidatus Vampirococcus lugosii]
MNFSIKNNDLNDVLDLCMKFISKSSTLPILENICIEAGEDGVVFKATDMEKYISFKLPVDVLTEGSLTVNGKIFLDIIRNIESDVVNFNKDDRNEILYLNSNEDKFEINGIASSEYIASPKIDLDESISLSAKNFVNGISKVTYSVTERNFSPILTGLLIRSTEDGLAFVGTDSFRLAEYNIPVNLNKYFDIIVPKLNIIEIQKVLDFFISKGGDDFELNFSNNLISFKLKTDEFSIYLTSILIQGNFPNYKNENIMPTNSNTDFEVPKNELEKAIRKISIFTRDINNFIDLSISSSGNIFIESGQTDKGNAKTSINTKINGDDVYFGVSGKYIQDFLKNIDSDTVIVRIVDNQNPIVFKDSQDNNLTYIVRPLVK